MPRWHGTSRYLDPLPFRLEAGSGLGGHVSPKIEDFIVEEVPAYEPCGFGEHTFLLVEKRGLSTPEAVRMLAQALGVPPREVGYAGLKDTWAITTQYFSVPEVPPERALRLQLKGIRILAARRHRNKLRIGHLRANRFRIRVLPEAEGAIQRAGRLLEEAARAGLPNLFGPQRFGSRDRNVRNGLRLLTGQAKRPNPRHTRFLASAVQAALFNAYVARRLEEGVLDQVLEGDVLARGHGYRLADRDGDGRPQDLTGPIFGPRTPRSPEHTRPAVYEQQVLEAHGVTPRVFAGLGRLARGGRRALLVFPEDVSAEQDERGGIWVAFTLPPGAYATVVLRELLQVPYARLRPFEPLEHSDQGPDVT